jgi:hypothetical protein
MEIDTACVKTKHSAFHPHGGFCLFVCLFIWFSQETVNLPYTEFSGWSLYWNLSVFIVRQELILHCSTHCYHVSHYQLWHSQQTDSLHKVANTISRCNQVALDSSTRKPSNLPSTLLPLNQDKTSVRVSKIPFVVTRFPYHKPSDAVSVYVWLKGPREFDFSFMEVLDLSSLFGLLVWLPW